MIITSVILFDAMKDRGYDSRRSLVRRASFLLITGSIFFKAEKEFDDKRIDIYDDQIQYMSLASIFQTNLGILRI